MNTPSLKTENVTTDMKTNHTPGTIKASPHGDSLILVSTDGGWITGQVGACGADRHANAERLAHCWNCHDELVEALEQCAFVLGECSVGSEKLSDLFPVKLAKARAILAKATREQS